MNIHIQKNHPPPPHLPTRNVLLCCLCLIVFLAFPIASQAQPARLTNPTASELAACGLPASWAQFNSDATVTTFNMTADCTFNASNIQANSQFLEFTSGEFTINGSGHSIIGPTNGWAIRVTNAGTVLNLNNVTFTGNTYFVSVSAWNGRLNARNIIFSGNTNNTTLATAGAGQIYIENVQFLGNIGSNDSPSVVSTAPGSFARITGSIFQGNTNFDSLIASRGTVELRGCITLGSNSVRVNYNMQPPDGVILGSPRACHAVSGHSIIHAPPKKKKKEKIPTQMPTSTPRPQIAATHVALQAATGATFRATFGLDSGVHFRQLDGAGIGIQSIIDAGFLEAFDVYGYVEQGVEVCFPQIGRVIFLDANTSPRTIAPLESTVVSGMTCVSINSPGSLVLLPN